jgi:hypothetical protein
MMSPSSRAAPSKLSEAPRPTGSLSDTSAPPPGTQRSEENSFGGNEKARV